MRRGLLAFQALAFQALERLKAACLLVGWPPMVPFFTY